VFAELPGPCQREASYAFVLSRPMMATALFGPARSSVFAAWASAQEHAEQGETAASKQRLAPFYAAELPASAFDASAIALRFGVDVESAERQVQQLALSVDLPERDLSGQRPAPSPPLRAEPRRRGVAVHQASRS
jgi:hypothetical protein